MRDALEAAGIEFFGEQTVSNGKSWLEIAVAGGASPRPGLPQLRTRRRPCPLLKRLGPLSFQLRTCGEGAPHGKV